MQLELNENFKGKCLVAMPGSGDAIFNQSVIYISEHSTIVGAVGIIINKSVADIKNTLILEPDHFAKVQEKGNLHSLPLHLGGPVELDSGFILYSDVKDGEFTLTSNKRSINQLIENKEINPLMVSAGYCMWETLQLEREVKFNNWLVIENITERLINTVNPHERYEEALRVAGVHDLAKFDFGGGGNA